MSLGDIEFSHAVNIEELRPASFAYARDLALLGSFRAVSGGRARVMPRSAARLIAVVALSGPLSRAQAAGMLWPDAGQGRAAASLRSALMRLNAIDGGFVGVSGDVLWTPEDVRVDVHALMDWVNAAIYAGEQRKVAEPPSMVGKDLLPDWDEEWLVVPRERLQLLQVQALETSAKRLLGAGHPGEALPYALLAVQAQPWSESANRLLIETHVRRGDPSNALVRFRRYRSVLRRELGVEPSSEMLGMMRQIFPFALFGEDSHQE